MGAGQLIAFINYLTQTLMSLMMVSMLVVRLSRAAASAVRIEGVLESEPDVKAPVETTAIPRIGDGADTEATPAGVSANGSHTTNGSATPDSSTVGGGRIAFENVTFSYSGSDRDPVLRDVSFVAEPGQTVAVLGATGSGKSSLVNLVPRFYDVTAGRVTVDGVDVRKTEASTLRKTIAAALQESVLFSGTIRDNIRYSRPDASDTDVEAAARTAQAHDFISRFPEGYDSVVGQRGVNLSGGQKQRIAIARALLAQNADLDPGRQHKRGGRRDGSATASGAGGDTPGPDTAGGGATHQHGAGGGSDRGAGRRADRGARDARVAVRVERDLPRDLRIADGARGGGTWRGITPPAGPATERVGGQMCGLQLV